MNTTESNSGGWRDSMLRKNLNDESTGTIWNAIQSADFKNNITPVLKTTNNNSNNNSDNTSNASSITVDKLFILSPSEMGMPIIKNYKNIYDYDVNQSNANVHYYDSDSYKNTIKSDSNKTYAYAWFTFYNYIYSGNAYQWWMLPAGFRKMNNGNQAYHNTDSYNIYNIGDFYWLRSAYSNNYSFAIIDSGCIWGNSIANNIGVVVSFSF